MCNLELSWDAPSTTVLLSPKRIDGPMTLTPRYSSVEQFALMCSMADRAAVDSAPYVAVLTVDCSLLYQSKGVWLMKWSSAVTDFPFSLLWHRLASAYVYNRTGLPCDEGASLGCSSLAPAYGILDQSTSGTTKSEKSGTPVRMPTR